jgi:hypothetical protein
MAMEAVAGLAGTNWKQGEEVEAFSLDEEVMDYPEHHLLEGVDEPIRIYLTLLPSPAGVETIAQTMYYNKPVTG